MNLSAFERNLTKIDPIVRGLTLLSPHDAAIMCLAADYRIYDAIRIGNLEVSAFGGCKRIMLDDLCAWVHDEFGFDPRLGEEVRGFDFERDTKCHPDTNNQHSSAGKSVPLMNSKLGEGLSVSLTEREKLCLPLCGQTNVASCRP